MNRLNQLDPARATGKTKELFDAAQKRFGAVPNLIRVLGNSPAALAACLQLGDTLDAGSFNAKLREQIALAVAETNMCGYCLSAHAFTGSKIGLTQDEIVGARRAHATVEKTDAILMLARAIVVQRGELSDSDLKQARIAGLTDGDIVETVANIVLNIFTNYVNHITHTVVDFPELKPGQPRNKVRFGRLTQSWPWRRSLRSTKAFGLLSNYFIWAI
jgi:uncharacterized peroxidase-related enzyme